MKRFTMLWILVLLAALLLAGCGGATPTPPPATEQPQATEAPTEVAATEAAPTEAPAEAPATAAPTEEAQAAEAPAEGLLATIKERGKIIVGTSADYPPYESVDDAGNFVGFDMDMIREIAKRMGVEVEIKDMAFDGLIAAVQEGKIDAVIAAMQATPERLEQVDFSEPYHFQTDAFLVAGNPGIVIEKPTDAGGHSIGVQTGTTHERWVQEYLIKPGLITEDQFFRYERVDQGALDVAAGRLDILFINGDPAKELADKQGLKIALLTTETVVGGQAIAMPKGASDLKAELDKIIGEMEKEGAIRQLLDTWKIPYPEQQEEAAAAAPAETDKYLAAIKERGKIIVGTSADYPPYESVDDAGNFVGFDIDIIQEVGQRMGVEVEIKDMAFDGLIAAVQEGKIDAVIAAMQATPERLEQVDFSEPYHFQTDAFLVAGNPGIVIEKPTDAGGHSIGVQTGTTHERWVQEYLIEPGLITEDQLFRYERVDQGALDVAAGRLDILFINGDPAKELADKQGLKIALLTTETVVGGQAIAMPKDATSLKAEIDKALKGLEEEGVIKELLQKHNIP